MPLNLCRALREPETFGSGKISPFSASLASDWRLDARFLGGQTAVFLPCVCWHHSRRERPVADSRHVVFHRRFRGAGLASDPSTPTRQETPLPRETIQCG